MYEFVLTKQIYFVVGFGFGVLFAWLFVGLIKLLRKVF
jgi:hypothetical protein